ncbi:DUF1576 domain-containing protein [Clostridium tertium]|uniref:DUF1576 domain-containing protein n=1 Tax=Clostridium tertium TaxID=1559 RepID=A0A6N3GBT3_9CLOT
MIYIKERRFYPPYIVISIINLLFFLTAFILDSPREILSGLTTILKSPDILITDYVELGGIGAALINSSLTSFIPMIILILLKVKPTGSIIMSLWLIKGFAFFGKNILNIWPIMIGVYLYSKYKKEPFSNYILVALLSTTLAPTVSQFSYTGHFPNYSGIILGYSLGILTGFILSPIASYCFNAHSGYNLYNVGFAAGLFATLLMAILRALGIEFPSRLIWNVGSNLEFSILLFSISIFLIIIGSYKNKNLVTDMKNIFKSSGILSTDFYESFGRTSYFNMGILGLLSTSLVLIINGDLNGPTISGIFTIIGFGAFGKHMLNVIPVIIGALIGAYININPINSPSLILSILFSTALAPIAGKFGWLAGILAGVLHVNMVSNIGYLHGGLNLYNNGLGAGFVAMLLVPILKTFKPQKI